jgi:hypothetical protein
MAVLFSYNFAEATSLNHNHVQSMLERFGWQSVGGSAYRYPSIDDEPLFPEDWWNAVIPALMCFRSYVLQNELALSHFSLDAHSSTGYSALPSAAAPRAGNDLQFVRPSNAQFGERNLRDWVDAATTATPYQP